MSYLTTHTSLSPIRRGFAPSFVNYKKRCIPLAAASDKVYQLLAHGRWFSPGNPAFSTTKTGRHDILEILLKVALSTKFKFKFKMFGSNTTNGHTHDSQNRLLSPILEGMRTLVLIMIARFNNCKFL